MSTTSRHNVRLTLRALHPARDLSSLAQVRSWPRSSDTQLQLCRCYRPLSVGDDPPVLPATPRARPARARSVLPPRLAGHMDTAPTRPHDAAVPHGGDWTWSALEFGQAGGGRVGAPGRTRQGVEGAERVGETRGRGCAQGRWVGVQAPCGRCFWFCGGGAVAGPGAVCAHGAREG